VTACCSISALAGLILVKQLEGHLAPQIPNLGRLRKPGQLNKNWNWWNNVHWTVPSCTEMTGWLLQLLPLWSLSSRTTWEFPQPSKGHRHKHKQTYISQTQIHTCYHTQTTPMHAHMCFSPLHSHYAVVNPWSLH